MESNQITQFNNQFLKYYGLGTCTAHDIVSVANLAKEYNKNNEKGIFIPDTYDGMCCDSTCRDRDE